VTFAEARRRREAARKLVNDISSDRVRKWTLHIPASEDDPDVVLDDALLALDEMTRRAEASEQLTLVYEVVLRWVANMAARRSGVPEDAPPFTHGYWRAVFEDALAAGAFVQAGCGTQGITEAMRRLGAEGVDPPPSATEDVDEWVRQQRSGEDEPPARWPPPWPAHCRPASPPSSPSPPAPPPPPACSCSTASRPPLPERAVAVPQPLALALQGQAAGLALGWPGALPDPAPPVPLPASTQAEAAQRARALAGNPSGNPSDSGHNPGANPVRLLILRCGLPAEGQAVAAAVAASAGLLAWLVSLWDGSLPPRAPRPRHAPAHVDA